MPGRDDPFWADRNSGIHVIMIPDAGHLFPTVSGEWNILELEADGVFLERARRSVAKFQFALSLGGETICGPDSSAGAAADAFRVGGVQLFSARPLSIRLGRLRNQDGFVVKYKAFKAVEFGRVRRVIEVQFHFVKVADLFEPADAEPYPLSGDGLRELLEGDFEHQPAFSGCDSEFGFEPIDFLSRTG